MTQKKKLERAVIALKSTQSALVGTTTLMRISGHAYGTDFRVIERLGTRLGEIIKELEEE